MSSEHAYPIVCDERGARPVEETCRGEIKRLNAALDASRAQAEALAEVLRKIAELIPQDFGSGDSGSIPGPAVKTLANEVDAALDLLVRVPMESGMEIGELIEERRLAAYRKGQR